MAKMDITDIVNNIIEAGIDITDFINNIIEAGAKAGLARKKDVSDTHHTFKVLYERERQLLRVITCSFPKLSFKSLHHYDEETDPMFGGDFMVGLYTPKGPISYHFKLEYLDDFAHLEFSPRGPKYDNYTEEEKNERLNSICEMIINGYSEDEILDAIINNPDLDESLKPQNFTR